MERTYEVGWTDHALDVLLDFDYPEDILRKIIEESIRKLSYMPLLMAKKIPFGNWEGYYARLGKYQVTLIYEVDEDVRVVSVDHILHKRQNKYWYDDELDMRRV